MYTRGAGLIAIAVPIQNECKHKRMCRVKKSKISSSTIVAYEWNSFTEMFIKKSWLETQKKKKFHRINGIVYNNDGMMVEFMFMMGF